jgi:hypothetical protein
LYSLRPSLSLLYFLCWASPSSLSRICIFSYFRLTWLFPA